MKGGGFGGGGIQTMLMGKGWSIFGVMSGFLKIEIINFTS